MEEQVASSSSYCRAVAQELADEDARVLSRFGLTPLAHKLRETDGADRNRVLRGAFDAQGPAIEAWATDRATRGKPPGELCSPRGVPTQAPAGPHRENIVLMTDSYKVTHHKQYQKGTTLIYSYFECRGGLWEDVVFFGLQYFLKRYLVGPVVTYEMIDEAEKYFSKHFAQPGVGYDKTVFNRAGWEHIVRHHGGHLPISIRAVPEGTVVPYKNVYFTMENTDPECFWLTNYLETLLVEVWYPITVATQSRVQAQTIVKWLGATGTPDALHSFKLHDFGYRGVSSHESAGIGAAAHLISFLGTDTMAGIVVADKYYGCECAGFSIPAAEHSTITSWGREHEVDAFRNMLDAYPEGLMACVSDSYDIFNACENLWGGVLRDRVMNRNGLVVIRPDSGQLPGIVIDVLESLAKVFPTTTTPTGHRLLCDKVRVIQGDGINYKSLDSILATMADAGWAADNLAFGSGGALLQKLHRDTLKVAFKCCEAITNGKNIAVYKDPITDPGKKSKRGRLTLERENGRYVTKDDGQGDPRKDLLVEVYRNGRLLVDQTFDDIRARAAIK